jgi:hypothetical protein
VSRDVLDLIDGAISAHGDAMRWSPEPVPNPWPWPTLAPGQVAFVTANVRVSVGGREVAVEDFFDRDLLEAFAKSLGWDGVLRARLSRMRRLYRARR